MIDIDEDKEWREYKLTGSCQICGFMSVDPESGCHMVTINHSEYSKVICGKICKNALKEENEKTGRRPI